MVNYLLQPGNPHDFTRDELEDLELLVRTRVPGTDVRLQDKDEQGYGVTLYEVIQVVADVRGAGGDIVLGAVAMWLRQRWKRDKAAGRRPRPRSVVLLDSNGEKLGAIDIDEPDGEPREVPHERQ